jgi:hypothetical protein
MRAWIVSASLVVAGVIHLLPLGGVLGGTRLAALYGVPIADPSLEILMRHRAVLFGLLGMLLVYAAFRPAAQPLALAAGLVSTSSFIALAWAVGGYNAAIGRVVTADLVALGVLLAAGVLRMTTSFGPLE